MIIKKIKVNNIRSYLNQEIDLPEGSVLLAGDIGSGKSSLLLAIEFALFGLQKGELSGSSLLRNGKDEGSVELHLRIKGEDFIIYRSLKRTKTSINQDECYLYTNGIKKQLTPIELRQLVLNLLNYPKENITKKPVIYRYTVYTPQEQMKQILFDDDETRINTIRKIFSLDKYGKIKSNSKIITETLKENINKMSGIVLDLDSLIKKQEEKETQKENTNKEIKEIEEPLKKLKSEISEFKDNIKNKENEIKLLNKLKRENDILKTELKNILSKKEYNIKKLSELESKIKIIPEYNPKEKEGKENSLRLMEKELKEITKNLNELNVNIKKSEETIKKISNLNICPLCEQNVAHNHKENVISRENKLIAQIKADLDSYLKKERDYEDNLTKLKNEIELSRKKENEYNILKIQVKLNQELKNAIEEEQKLLESNFKDLEKKSNIEQAVQLKKLILVSFILHIYAIGVEPMKALSRILLLEAFDRFWMEHLDTMTDLREGISLRNLAQRDPLVEYKNEGFKMFDDMLKKVDESIVTRFFKVRLVKREEQIPVKVNSNEDKRPGNVGKQKTIKKNNKVGRNDPCPCGSGKKYKKCCFPKYD